MADDMVNAERLKLRTYWHLAGRKKIPDEYDIVSSRLLYHAEKGLETDLPLGGWQKKFQTSSPLKCTHWDDFDDPARLTYFTYVERQRESEHFIARLFESLEAEDMNKPSPAGIELQCARAMDVLRFACHGLQMLAAYVGHLAPSGKLVIMLSFQAANESRRLQTNAYRLALLRKYRAYAPRGKNDWEKAPDWQPLRKYLEHALCTFDWAQAFAVSNLVLKPLLDDVFMYEMTAQFSRTGEALMAEIFKALQKDCEWQRNWTTAFVNFVSASQAQNRVILQNWLNEGLKPAMEALEPLVKYAGCSAGKITERHAVFLDNAGLHYETR